VGAYKTYETKKNEKITHDRFPVLVVLLV